MTDRPLMHCPRHEVHDPECAYCTSLDFEYGRGRVFKGDVRYKKEEEDIRKEARDRLPTSIGPITDDELMKALFGRTFDTKLEKAFAIEISKLTLEIVLLRKKVEEQKQRIGELLSQEPW